jgi:hypothetical protein
LITGDAQLADVLNGWTSIKAGISGNPSCEPSSAASAGYSTRGGWGDNEPSRSVSVSLEVPSGEILRRHCTEGRVNDVDICESRQIDSKNGELGSTSPAFLFRRDNHVSGSARDGMREGFEADHFIRLPATAVE